MICNFKYYFKMLRCSSSLIKIIRRYCNYKSLDLLTEQLSSRSLIRISGNSAADFLQGLVTNDVNHLKKSNSCMFAMFLNTKGRVLFDSIIYSGSENEFFVECDFNVAKDLESHLKIYKVRRKISINNVADQYNIWAVNETNIVDAVMTSEVPPLPLNNRVLVNFLQETIDINFFSDPRIFALGARGFVSKAIDLTEQVKQRNIIATNANFYQLLRYRLGVGEGANEMPQGVCLPLEANCDYLHGISFHKGCYIGQELTARTHHTGVVRKRIMPLQFENNGSIPEFHSPVTIDTQERPVGKFISKTGKLGIGLLRIQEVLKENIILIGQLRCKTYRPFWWPTEAPKGRPA